MAIKLKIVKSKTINTRILIGKATNHSSFLPMGIFCKTHQKRNKIWLSPLIDRNDCKRLQFAAALQQKPLPGCRNVFVCLIQTRPPPPPKRPLSPYPCHSIYSSPAVRQRSHSSPLQPTPGICQPKHYFFHR